jgi:thymidylate kinase
MSSFSNGESARLLLVEGVPGIGKSTLIDQLLRSYAAATPVEQIRTVLTLAQTHTYGPLAVREDEGTLTREDCLSHLGVILERLEWLVWSAASATRTKCVVLIDTLHLTHCLRPGVVAWNDVEEVDSRLAAMGARLLLLDAADQTVEERSVIARADTEFIQHYALGRFGRDEAELVRYFQAERDEFRTMFERSSMRKLLLAAESGREELASEAAGCWLGG